MKTYNFILFISLLFILSCEKKEFDNQERLEDYCMINLNGDTITANSTYSRSSGYYYVPEEHGGDTNDIYYYYKTELRPYSEYVDQNDTSLAIMWIKFNFMKMFKAKDLTKDTASKYVPSKEQRQSIFYSLNNLFHYEFFCWPSFITHGIEVQLYTVQNNRVKGYYSVGNEASCDLDFEGFYTSQANSRFEIDKLFYIDSLDAFYLSANFDVMLYQVNMGIVDSVFIKDGILKTIVGQNKPKI